MVKKILRITIAPYLDCQDVIESNLVQAVAAPDIATAIALHNAIWLNLGKAILRCLASNWASPINPPTHRQSAETCTTNAPIANP